MTEVREHRGRSSATDSGSGSGKLVVTLLILGAIAYVASQALPPDLHNYELRDYANSLVLESVANRIKAGDIPGDIVERAQELKLPVEAEDVAVESGGSEVRVRIKYTVPVDLKLYMWPMRLSVSASAPKLVY